MIPLVILSEAKDLAVLQREPTMVFGRDTARSFAALRTTS